MPEDLQWYQIAAGILAIPTALIGIVYSWALLKKTRLESRKAELEIAEMEAAAARATPAPAALEAARAAVQPFATARRFETIVMRFVVLCLVFLLWTAFEHVLDLAFLGTALALTAAGADVSNLGPWGIVLGLIRRIPDVGSIVIIVVFGWPLLRDIGRSFGIGLSVRSDAIGRRS